MSELRDGPVTAQLFGVERTHQGYARKLNTPYTRSSKMPSGKGRKTSRL